MTARIERLDPGDVDRLRPLWLALHAHHQAVSPELAPYVDDDVSWAARRALYAGALADGGCALVAVDGATDVGYALAAPEPAPWPTTIATTPRIGELLTVLVRPEARGGGLGSALLDAVEAFFDAEAPDDDRAIGVLPRNTRAAALYVRRGYRPMWVTMTRFQRPSPLAAGGEAATVDTLDVAEVDDVHRLWLAHERRRRAVAPELAPYRDEDAAWVAMRERLVAAARSGLLLRAGPAAAPRGLVGVTVTPDDPLWGDTWRTGRDVAELALLAVDPADATAGTALLDAVDARLAAVGIADQVLGAVAPDTATIAAAAARGFRPAWLQLLRRR